MAKNDAQTPTASPPGGIGAVPGLGEAFQVNLNTGQGVYSYKLTLPAGVAGHTPSLGLEYRHGNRAGALGLGWQLPVRSIDRRLDLGSDGHDSSATESYRDGSTLLVALQDGTYGAECESSFNRYRRAGAGWTIEERTGVVHTLGTTPDSRVADPDHPERVVQWLVDHSTDPFGNTITYAWDVIDGFPYLVTIRYAAYEVRCGYATRPDVRLDGRAGFLRRLTRRCTAIELYLDPGPSERRLRAWTLAYADADPTGTSLLASIQLTSFGPAADAAEDVVRTPVRFTYSAFDPAAYQVTYLDANGSTPPTIGDPDTALLTLDQAPLPGVLQVVNGRQYYWRNTGHNVLEGPRRLADTPFSGSFASAGVAFVDLGGSGSADLLIGEAGVPGYYENAGAAGWGRYVAYPRDARAMPVWSSPRVRLADVDADGRIDAIQSADRYMTVWRNLGAAGWAAPILAPKPAGDDAPDVDFADPRVFLADMTGDGLQDIVRVNSGSVEYWPSLGNGRFGPRQRMFNSPRLRNLFTGSSQTLLVDIDGDGCADLLRLGPDGLEIYRNCNGAGFTDQVVLDTLPPPIPGTARLANASGGVGAGLLWSSYRGREVRTVSLTFDSTQQSRVLTDVDNGAGLRSTLAYRSATDDFVRDHDAGRPWTTNFPFPFLVVAETHETDLVSGQVTDVRYQYHEAHYETRTRQFQGFRSAERIEVGDESRPDTLTRFTFLMGMERQPGSGPEASGLNGLLASAEVCGLDGAANQHRPYRSERSSYKLTQLTDTLDGQPRAFVAVATHRLEDSERSDDARVEEKTFTYDTLGNVVREVLRGSGQVGGVAQPELERTLEVTYAASASHYILGKSARQVVRDADGQIVSETRTYYDGPDFEGLPLGQMDRGALARESRLVLTETEFQAHYTDMDPAALGYRLDATADGEPARFLDARREAHDARGLLIGEREPVGDQSATTFDIDGLFRVALVDSLGETRFVYDRAAGQPSTITYGDGSIASFRYDAQGRVLAALMPGDDASNPPRRHIFQDASVPNLRVTRMQQPDGVTSEVRTYFTGRGAEFQTRAQVDPTTWLVSGRRIVNPWGDLRQEFEPAYSASPEFDLPPVSGVAARTVAYDARGRVVRSVNFTGGVSSAEYQPFAVVTADADDNDHSPSNVARGLADTPHREEFDAFRQRTRVVEVLGGGDAFALTYVPDANGRVLSASDALGPLFECTYDKVGHRLTTLHRDAGLRRLYYDARGKVVRSLDASGNDLTVELDERGRVVRLHAGGETIEQYTYDDLALNAYGKLARVEYAAGSQTFHYDQGGRISQHVVSFSAADAPPAHTITHEYDPLGRQTSAVHSDGTRIERRLTFNGWVAGIPGVLDDVAYDPRGVPRRITYTNGVVTDLTYLPGPPRVATQDTRGPTGQVYEQLAYDFDALGLLLASDDRAPGGRGRTSYALDPLYQVKSTSFSEGGTPVTQQYEYANHVNLSRLEESDSRFAYDDALHPDRLTGVTVGAASRVEVGYDANGNIRNLPGKSFAYNVKNELARFTADNGLVADYAYDHRGLRVSKHVDDGHGFAVSTFFVGLDVEIRAGVPAYFVRLGDRRVAILQQGHTSFVHDDYTGSSAFFSSDSGLKVASITYRPFGNVAASAGGVDVRTFGMHPFDVESGLYYMRRRFYAPEIGRFLTPDPLAVHQPQSLLTNPKALYPYLYVGNDPLDNVDYDGLTFWSVVGAIVGVIVVSLLIAMTVGLIAVIGVAAALVIAGLLTVGLVTVGYLGANGNRGTATGEFWRGFMIGVNAGLNATLGSMVFGPVVGLAMGVVTFLSAVDPVAGDRGVFQHVLGYSSSLMPMSWLATGLGLSFFIINLIALDWTSGQWNAARIDNIHINWATGSIVTVGGLIRPYGSAIGFDMGTFVFLTPGSTAEPHETGHALSLAAYGSIFHFIGAIDENITGGGPDAFAEHLADSHDPSLGMPGRWWDIWDPRHA